MSEIYALVVVDVLGALASGSAMDNSYLVDNNGVLASWNEGTPQLHTVCSDGQVIFWMIVPVSPSGQVTIAGFSGPMVDGGTCVPAQQAGSGGQVWSGRVESRGQFASFPYTLTVSVGGRPMSLGAFIKVA